MIFSVISSVLIIISIVCLFGLTPEQVTDDLMRLITPNDTMRDRSRNLRGNKKKHRLYRTLVKMKTALAVTGKSKQFTIVCCASLVLFAAGIILSVLIDNIFLMPVLSVAFALIPFFYTTSTLSYYEKNTKEELETALSIITTSYVRSDDIVAAVSISNRPFVMCSNPLRAKPPPFPLISNAHFTNLKVWWTMKYFGNGATRSFSVRMTEP